MRTALDLANELKSTLEGAKAQKVAYEKQYQMFRKLLRIRDKELPLNEVVDCIDKIIIGADKQIVVEWCIFKAVTNSYDNYNNTFQM